MATYLKRVTTALSVVLMAATFAHSVSGTTKRSPRKFKLVEHSCESGCADTYESADGKQVSFIFACHTATAADAREEIQRMLSEGTVVSWSPRIGKKKLSERIVMLHPLEDGKRVAKIFWYRMNASCFSYIEAESLALALEFERSKAANEPLAPYIRRSKG